MIANAVKVIRIATNENEEQRDIPDAKGKETAAVSMDKGEGKARAESMTPERCAEIAKKAVEKRWAKN